MQKLYSYVEVLTISEKDIRKKLIRILKHNKSIFPLEERGYYKKFPLTFCYKKKLYDCIYAIGSKDGKSRSGMLWLDHVLYDKLQISPSKKITIVLIGQNKYKIKIIGKFFL